jgi:phosphatidylserine decarboxylase
MRESKNSERFLWNLNMKREESSIIREGFYIALVVFGISGVAYLAGFFFVAALLFCFSLFVLFFFRNPRRDIPSDEKAVLSPADGKVVDIRRTTEENFLDRESTCISIFLSIFDVHVNRAPSSGVVKKVEYVKGSFLPAFREKASLLNERNSVLIDFNNTEILVRQIAGLIARRIVCWVKEGDSLARGQRFGLIRFGSRVDIFLPANIKVEVKVGDKIKGGETIIATLTT